MLALERRQKIVEIVQEKKRVVVIELAQFFDVTEETIRRDLEKLEDQGILKRTYGGAILNESTDVDIPMYVREMTNQEGKAKIALKVIEIIKDGETLMLDSSSTALCLAKCIKRSNKKVTIITNSLKVVVELQDMKNINIILAGGNFRERSKSFVGKWSEKLISNYHVNKAILCCKGMDIERGIMDSNEQEAEIKKEMAKCADEVLFLVDHIKFNRTSFVRLMNFEDIDAVYTDEEISEEWKKVFKENNVKVVIA